MRILREGRKFRRQRRAEHAGSVEVVAVEETCRRRSQKILFVGTRKSATCPVSRRTGWRSRSLLWSFQPPDILMSSFRHQLAYAFRRDRMLADEGAPFPSASRSRNDTEPQQDRAAFARAMTPSGLRGDFDVVYLDVRHFSGGVTADNRHGSSSPAVPSRRTSCARRNIADTVDHAAADLPVDAAD